MMMMNEVADHSKRNHTDSSHLISSSSAEDFGSTTTSKKPRASNPRTTSMPPKQQKDKVSERVAALQQIVSPFGKTDTASVLQEATVYIKFLHQQLEVLGSPYLRGPVAGSSPEDSASYSLRGRGLCLVPVEEALQLTQSNGADLWATANPIKRR